MENTARSNIDRIPGLADLRDRCGRASEITIAVIDGPVDISHPVFGDARLDHLGGLSVAEAAQPSRSHGTHVSSILFGRSDGPVSGIAPACRGLLISVFSDTADGGIRPCSETDMARALLLARDHGAHVINISSGRPSGSGTACPHLDDAIRQCIDSGVLVVAAAGNDGCDCLQVPAALPGVLVVGAMDDNGEPVGFSNWGNAYRDRGVLAPGTHILGASVGGDVIGMSGTSFAAPLVAGAAALLMARQLEQGDQPDARLVMNAIVEGADRCDPSTRDRCERFLAGVLNVAEASKRLESPSRATMRGLAVGMNTMERSEGMDEHRDEARTQATVDPMARSIQAMADSIAAMQTSIADLGRAVGGMRPSGLVDPAADTAASTRDTEPAGARGVTARNEPGGPAMATVSQDALMTPSACCDACAAAEARQLVFALGKLDYDFGTEARMDSIQMQMDALKMRKPKVFKAQPVATQPADLVAFLKEEPSVSPAVGWILKLGETPIYGIRPESYYVQETYAFLVDTLEEQTRTAADFAAWDPESSKGPIPPPPVERMSLPGIVNGEVELMNGLVIPSVRPARAGMFTWSTKALVDALGDLKLPKDAKPLQERADTPFDPLDGLRTFLNRIYEELRNVGLAPQDRALNFAASNAYQAYKLFVGMRGRNIHIEKFEVVRSPVMRPDSDCWDIKMTFYNPESPTTKPREVYFYTIDVSDQVPVAIGQPRHWTTF